jgi:capsular polysaccharide biosynthesis protein
MRYLPIIVALAVAVAGLGYAAVRTPTYESTAQLVLVPQAKDPAVDADLLSSVSSAGTVGTYVELYGSADVAEAAGDPDVTITVRSVPDSRIIGVTASGDEDNVQEDLRRILAAGLSQEPRLKDSWGTAVIQQPTAPEQAPPSTGMILLATLLLAILAGVFTAVLLRRAIASGAVPGDQRRPRPSPG